MGTATEGLLRPHDAGIGFSTVKEGQASRTAQYVALFRAIESRRPPRHRLFEDPFAEKFLAPPLAAVALLCRVPGMADALCALIDRRWAGARSSAVARTRLIDDTLNAALVNGATQVVILGAGFDSRAYRLPALAGASVFEVDHPDTLARKRAVVSRGSVHVPPNVRFVATDFRESDLARAMKEAAYSSDALTFILWEGVTAYLTADAVDSTLKWCAGAAPGSQVLFTYIHRAILDDPASFAGTKTLFATLKAAGEPWSFGFYPEELGGYLQQRGLRLERDIGSSEYRARYLPDLRNTIQGYEFYRLAIAKVP